MNSYYKDKAKDSEQQAIYLVWLVIIAVFIGTWYCTYKWITHKCPELSTPSLPSLCDIQRRIGVEPDGIYGEETEAKWDAAYANQEAAKFFTPTGGLNE